MAKCRIQLSQNTQLVKFALVVQANAANRNNPKLPREKQNKPHPGSKSQRTKCRWQDFSSKEKVNAKNVFRKKAVQRKLF